MRKRLYRDYLMSAAMCLSASVLPAQQFASVSGIVTDSSGAVIPSVTVALVNAQTGEKYSGATNESGQYAFPLAKPGNYRITAEASGFKQFTQTGIILETGTPARIDIHLEVFWRSRSAIS